MRLFVAAYPPAEAVEDLAAVVSQLAVGRPADGPGTSLRLAPPERWHVTVAFLGDVPDSAADTAADAVRAGATAVAEPMELRIAGGGRFGRGRFTVMWAGLDGDLAGLHGLTDSIRRELRRARLPYDRKPFRPHLTLARPGDRLPAEVLAADLAVLESYAGPPWRPGAVDLMRSRLGPRPSYEVVQRVAL